MNYERKITDRTFDFAVAVIKFCQKIDRTDDISKILVRQMVRSSTSIGANIEEAQFAQSKRDFIHKTSISAKEARETLYWLKIFRETIITKDEPIESLIKESDEIISILTIIIRNAKRSSEKEK